MTKGLALASRRLSRFVFGVAIVKVSLLAALICIIAANSSSTAIEEVYIDGDFTNDSFVTKNYKLREVKPFTNGAETTDSSDKDNSDNLNTQEEDNKKLRNHPYNPNITCVEYNPQMYCSCVVLSYYEPVSDIHDGYANGNYTLNEQIRKHLGYASPVYYCAENGHILVLFDPPGKPEIAQDTQEATGCPEQTWQLQKPILSGMKNDQLHGNTNAG